MKKRLVVIGGTAAGLSAASRVRNLLPEMEIEVFEKTGYTSYGSCGLPYFVGNLIKEPAELVTLTPKQLGEERGIIVHTRHQAEKIDRRAKTVEVTDLKTGARRTVTYDKLVVATGALPVIPDLPGIREIVGTYFLRTVEDGIALKKAVRDSSLKQAVIVGGGFIGLELAEAISQAGVAVTIIEALPRLLPTLNPAFSEKVERELADHKVTLLKGMTVGALEHREGKLTGVTMGDGRRLDCRLAVFCVGVRPNSALAAECGLEIGLKGGIVVDDHLRTSDPDIWACGDCVQMFHLLTGKPVYFPLGTTANKQGRLAGGNIGGEDRSFAGVLGSQVTKVFDLYIASSGLNEARAKEAGFDPATVLITKNDRASYYPGGTDNHLFLIFDRISGRLLGAEAVGGISIAGRINVLATAITAGMTVEEINRLDLVYAPPVAPVYDPILIAAGQALKKVKG